MDKQLDIHSIQCAELPVLEDRLDLSHHYQAGIPPFYSDFQGAQVLDLVDKFALIHKNIDVYYYYQNIYIQVNLKQ